MTCGDNGVRHLRYFARYSVLFVVVIGDQHIAVELNISVPAGKFGTNFVASGKVELLYALTRDLSGS